MHDLRPEVTGHDVVLDLSARVRHATPRVTSKTPRAGRSAGWSGARYSQKIRIPRQDFEAPKQLYDREHLMFSPWNCLPKHRPLGSINRMRLAVYLASLQVRRKLNMVGA